MVMTRLHLIFFYEMNKASEDSSIDIVISNKIWRQEQDNIKLFSIGVSGYNEKRRQIINI